MTWFLQQLNFMEKNDGRGIYRLRDLRDKPFNWNV